MPVSLFLSVMRRVFAIALVSLFASVAQADAAFQAWIASFCRDAVQQGITARTCERAFHGITAPDTRVLEKAAYQPEFKTDAWEYIDNRVNERAISQGRFMLKEHAPLLARLERETGVSRHVLLAIWSMESNYGAVLQDKKRLHDIPQALATLAYADEKRSAFGRSQLLAALKILQAGDVSREDMLGSWAGAMGHTQFIPTSYLLYAVDADGDGKRDIWHSVPDALASAAQLLKKNGWRSGERWGHEITTPASGQQEILALQGDQGPVFALQKNFFVVKRYNNADKYALAVLLLADRIAGLPAPVQDWQRPYAVLDLAGKQQLQQLLREQGFYSGEVDGMIGDESRRAIQRFQASAGLAETGYPSVDVLSALQKRQRK